MLIISPAFAQEEAKEPMVITSDSLEFESLEAGNVFRFSGNVKIEAEALQARCKQMEIHTLKSSSGGESIDVGAIEVIEATGNVYIKQGERTAMADKAYIYPKEEKIVLEGSPSIEDAQGGVVTGHRITMNRAQGLAQVEGGESQKRPTVRLNAIPDVRKKMTKETTEEDLDEAPSTPENK